MEKYLNRDLIINNFYNEFIAATVSTADNDPNKYACMCGWTNKYNQYKRFEILLGIGVKEKDSLLDIGCGAGELVQYLQNNDLKINYTGVDINPIYLRIAYNRFTKDKFLLSNGWDLDSDMFDWAIASGIFTLEANITFIQWYIGYVMEKLVKKGFAFNLLMNNNSNPLISYSPDIVYNELTCRFPEYQISIIQDYLPDDFTVYVKK